MSDPWALLLASLGGGAIGLFFYGGLWWTVRRVVTAKQPALWIFSSFFVRTGVALAGFYLVSGRHLDQLFLSLLAFILARRLVTRLTKPKTESEQHRAQGASHAP